MDAIALLQMLAGLHPIIPMILMLLGSLVVIGQIVVGLTPSKADDEAWEKIKGIPLLGSIVSSLTHFAVIQRK